MTGEIDLQKLLSTMSATLVDGVFVFVTVAPENMPQGLSPRMMFQEGEGITLITLQTEADAHALVYEFPCRMITLNVHSALQAVGFIAHISTALAAQGMGVNPVAGFYHDHLFVPQERAQDAMRVLARIADDAA